MNKKKYVNLAYIAINIIIIVVIGFLDPHIKDIGWAFYQLRLFWVILAALCMVLFWIMDALIIKYLLTSIYRPESFKKSMIVALVGQYYNAVTPFASGGQPVQIYYMSRFGIPAGYSSSVLIIKFLMYQIILSIFCIPALLLKSRFIISYSLVVFLISLVGFIINAGAVFLIYSLSFNHALIKKIVFKVLNFLHRIRIIKDIGKFRTRLETATADFHRSICLVRGNIKDICITAIITTLQLIFYFSVTYFIYRAFDLKGAEWWDMVFIQTFLYLAVCYFPTPGATGASEGGFYLFFSWFFPESLIFVSMIIWRFITFYLNILVGGLVVVSHGIHGLAEPDR